MTTTAEPKRQHDPRWSVGGELWSAELRASAGERLHEALLELSGFRVELHDLAKLELATAMNGVPEAQLENVERIATWLAECGDGRRRPGAVARYVYTDRDGLGIQDPALRAYGSPHLNQVCERAGPWKHGKALVRFTLSGELVVVRARLLRKVGAA